MKDMISTLYNKFLGSLDTQKGSGFSGRKLTALVLIICDVAIHIKWLAKADFSQMEMLLTIDYGFIATLLGMVTYQSIKENKQKEKEDAV